MDDLTPLVLLVPIAALLVSAGVPVRYASAAPDGWTAWIRWATAALLAASLAAGPLLGLGSRPLLQVQLGQATFDLFYWNGVASLMIALVSFVGWVVVRYSMRQLDGDPDSAAYHRNFATTLGGISLAVVAGNLLLMFAAWLLANVGLRRMLSHDRQHPGAAEGARMKRAVDRLGAFLLGCALILIYQQHGTWNLAQLFQPLLEQASSAASADLAGVIAWLLVLAAAVISVQFPFSFWLPETLATPTPVSALMHAGIINAGGYFLIRLNPLLAPAPAALTTLAAVGAVTLLLGGLAMLTQTSVKRTLAFSTIAQMGFMMLQCGLGAWTAAMLHIVAHSLYKAYAFLASGDVITVARAVAPVQESARRAGNPCGGPIWRGDGHCHRLLSRRDDGEWSVAFGETGRLPFGGRVVPGVDPPYLEFVGG